MTEINEHFTVIAHQYRDLRTTDPEPIEFIVKQLEGLNEIKAADVGCGTGRYDIELFKALGEKLFLYCLDFNREMLSELKDNLHEKGIKNFETVNSPSEEVPLLDSSLDAVVTFNAVHHFKLPEFFKEMSRILKKDSLLFVYSRTRSQNARNIWGRFFPKFNEKESRLFELGEIEKVLGKVDSLSLEMVKNFKYPRKTNMKRLLELAENFHYSTFYLYEKKELEESLQQFQENIKRNFKDTDEITWEDENILLVIKKK